MTSSWGIKLALGFFAAALIGACVPGTDEPTVAEGTSTINIKDSTFDPSTLTVKAGENVLWVNADRVTHTITSGERGAPDGQFRKDLVGNGVRLGYRYPDPGTFSFFCSVHSGMDGEVIVQ